MTSRYLPLHIACLPPTALSWSGFAASHLLHGSFFIVGVFFMFDAGARYREYCQLIDDGIPTDERTIKYFRSSYCRRHAAVMAGIPIQIFHDLGYRWYHFLPDDCPQCFFRLGFWRNFFGFRKREEKHEQTTF